jgi:hypothetical protein
VLQAYSGGVSQSAPLSSLFSGLGGGSEPARAPLAKKKQVKARPKE